MARRPRAAATFADIVREVRDAPVPEVQAVPTLTAPDGRPFYNTDRELTPEEALALVADGALVAWDSCGGLGVGIAGPVEWFDERSRERMVAAGPPELRNKRGAGYLLELRAEDGTPLVLAMYDVRWGDDLMF